MPFQHRHSMHSHIPQQSNISTLHPSSVMAANNGAYFDPMNSTSSPVYNFSNSKFASFARQISDSIYQPSLEMLQNLTEFAAKHQSDSGENPSGVIHYTINDTNSVMIWPNGSAINLVHSPSSSHHGILNGAPAHHHHHHLHGQMNSESDSSEFSIFTNPRHVLMILFYSLIILVSLTGNLLVCRVTFTNREMRTTTNLLIASLACSDIVMTVFNIPFNVVRMLPMSWPFGQLICILVPMIQYSCVYVSTFTMMLIALHRLWTVSQKRTVIARTSERRVALTVLGIWFVALTLSCPHAAFNRVRAKKFMGRTLHRCKIEFPDLGFNVPLWLSVEVLITQYLVPLSITAVVYVMIGRIIARQGQLICKLSDEKKRKQSEAKRRRIVMLALAVATFATCWAPINLYLFLVDLKLLHLRTDVFIVCHWFAMSSVCYNPIIYCWLNERFRNGAKQTIRSAFGCLCPRLIKVDKSSTLVGGGGSGGGGGAPNSTGGALTPLSNHTNLAIMSPPDKDLNKIEGTALLTNGPGSSCNGDSITAPSSQQASTPLPPVQVQSQNSTTSSSGSATATTTTTTTSSNGSHRHSLHFHTHLGNHSDGNTPEVANI